MDRKLLASIGVRGSPDKRISVEARAQIVGQTSRLCLLLVLFLLKVCSK